MKSMSVNEFRHGLKACTEEVQETGVPTVLLVHGRKTVGIVPVEWAEVLEQIAQFDKCDLGPDVLKAELNKLLQLALLEISASPELSLMKIVKKLAVDATVIQQYLGVRKLLKQQDA